MVRPPPRREGPQQREKRVKRVSRQIDELLKSGAHKPDPELGR
jgi:hypothetical protein